MIKSSCHRHHIHLNTTYQTYTWAQNTLTPLHSCCGTLSRATEMSAELQRCVLYRCVVFRCASNRSVGRAGDKQLAPSMAHPFRVYCLCSRCRIGTPQHISNLQRSTYHIYSAAHIITESNVCGPRVTLMTHYDTLQRTAPHGITLQHTVFHCNTCGVCIPAGIQQSIRLTWCINTILLTKKIKNRT